MTKRRVLAAALLAAAALALSGCSSAMLGVTGLTVSHGHVAALVEMCVGTTADEVHMTPAAGQFFLIPHPSWGFDKTSSGSVDLGTTAHFLKLVGGEAQEIQSRSSDGVGGFLRFKKSDVKSLRDGQILASSPTSANGTIVDAAGFDTLAKDLCAQNSAATAQRVNGP